MNFPEWKKGVNCRECLSKLQTDNTSRLFKEDTPVSIGRIAKDVKPEIDVK
jgi:hypothetical protein